jgi:hypothetical protein
MRTLRIRGWVAIALVVPASLGGAAAALGGRARATTLDTDRFVGVVGPVVHEDAVVVALGDALSRQLRQALDLGIQAARARLPEQLDFLAGPLEPAIRTFLEERVREFVLTDRFVSLWTAALRTTHARVVLVIENQAEDVVLGPEDLDLSLLPAMADLIRRLENLVPDLIADDPRIPQILPTTAEASARERLARALDQPLGGGFGQIVLVREQLTGPSELAQTLDLVTRIGLIVGASCAIGALLISPRRARTALHLALGVALATIAGRGLAVRVLDSTTEVASPGAGGPVLHAAMERIVEDVLAFGSVVVVVSLAVALGLVLVRDPRATARVRRALARGAHAIRPGGSASTWVASHGEALTLAGVALAAFILGASGISVPSLIAVALALGVYLGLLAALRRRADQARGRD